MGLPSLFRLDLPLVECNKLYKPGSLARRILNLEPSPEGTLRSIRGPVQYEPWAATAFDRVYGIFHSSSLGGANDLLVVRSGATLYRHAGWSRTWTTIATGLNAEARQRYPDVFVEVGGKVIWCNGVDRPLVINSARDYGDHGYPLGFHAAPAAPTALGPNPGDADSATAFMPPNSLGYSHQGRVGTAGDANQGQDGCLTAGTWQWALQHEDEDGNLGPLSALSNPVQVVTQSTTYHDPSDDSSATTSRLNNIDDLTRQFLVQNLDAGEDHVSYLRLYRTPDTQHNNAELHLVARIPRTTRLRYPDNIPDGWLMGMPLAEPCVAVPTFSIACEYQGRLVIFVGKRVMWSKPGFPGTFGVDDWEEPDAGGAEGTGLLSFGGRLLAWTARATYELNLDAEGPRSRPISKVIGCVAPKSAVTLDDGSAMWLALDGFYQMTEGGLPVRASADIATTVARINPSRAGTAVALYDPHTRQYRCSTAMDSQSTPSRVFCYDTERQGWREEEWGYHWTALCVTNDDRQYVLGGAFDEANATWGIYAMGLEAATTTLPDRWSSYETGWVRFDAQQSGAQRVRAVKLLVGFLESDTTEARVTYWRDGRTSGGEPPVVTTFTPVESDFAATWTFGTAVLGDDVFREPKLTWGMVDIDINNEVAAKVAIESLGYLEIVGLAFVAEPLDANRTSQRGGA